MIAHCPHCNTAFRIVADQLRVRDGRVRCGVCRQVFDGHAALEQARLDAAALASPAGPVPDAVLAVPTASPAPPPLLPPAPAPAPATAPVLAPTPTLAPTPAPAQRDAVAVPAPTFIITSAAGPATSVEPVLAPPRGDDHDDGPVLMIGREAGVLPVMVDAPRAVGGRAEPRLGDTPVGFSATDLRAAEPKAGYLAAEPRFTEPKQGFAAEPRFGNTEPGFTAADPVGAHERIVARPPAGRAEPVVGLSGWSTPAAADEDDELPPPTRAVSPAVTPDAPPARRMVASRPDAPLPPMLAADRRGGVLGLFWTLGFWLALLALVAQAIWWWRMPLAAYFPPLRAPLEILCQSVGCEVGYLRAPQRLAIVSSSVQPDVLGSAETGVQRLQLQATLRNRASHAQPWPALEIILTDHGDAMVARRVVLPSAYLPPSLQRQPFEAGAEYQVPLALTVRGTPVSGYRLNLFFP